jgi:hypothetical protein
LWHNFLAEKTKHHNMKKKYANLTLVILSLALITTDTFAFHRSRRDQAPPEISHGYIPQKPQIYVPQRSTSAPFDGGLSVLIVAGVGYAAKKGYDKRKNQKDVQHQ